jgi:hypothetical protein
MVRIGFFGRFLLAVLLIGLLAAGGVSLYRMGWVSGYSTGTLAGAAGAAGAEGASPVAPVAPYGYGFPLFFHPFGFFPMLVGFLFLFFLFGGLFRLWGWRHWSSGHWEHGHVPPWAQEWKEHHKEGSGSSAENPQPPSTTG